MDRNPRPKSAIVQRSGMMSSMRNRPTSSLQAWDNECRESDDFLQRIESLEKNFSVFDDVIRQMEEKYVETKTAVHLLKEEYQSKRMKEMEPLKRQNKFYEQDIGRRDREIKELTEEMKSTKDELERTKTRLSQVMGNKLTNNNPNIADLSDGNRPSKLAERLNEIYDNEWTDAYAALLKENKETEAIAEEEIVAELLRALMFINEHCKQLWKKHVSSLETDLKGGQDIDIPDYIKKQLKDCAKNMATEFVEFVYQDSIQALIHTSSGGQHRRIFQSSDYHSYIKGCVTVCWLMAAQDPPVVFGTESKKGDKFDPKVFKHYTRTGDLISFVVWPPLYLQEGGPLLSRGVAQTYIVEKEPRTGIPAHHISQIMTGDQSERSGMNLCGTQDHSQATSKQIFDPNVYTQPMNTNAWKNEQEPSKYQQNNLNLTSDHVHQEPIDISGRSQDSTTEAGKPSLVWNHSRFPTEREMRRLSRLLTRKSLQAARLEMGDEVFDLCYDFNNLQANLAFLDRSMNESGV